MTTTVLEVRDLRTSYRTRLNENVYAVDGVSLSLSEGNVLGIAGESGCGKSTLALSMMGFYFPPLHFIDGEILVRGRDIMTLPYETLRREYLGSRIAYIPQSAMNALNPTRRASHLIADVLKDHVAGIGAREIRRRAEERFEALKLPRRALDSYPNELSGGMKQRVIIAISTMLNPEILIADEPTSALDVSSQKTVMVMMRELLKEGFVKSIIFITHELPLLRHIADTIMVMYAGKIVERGPTEDVIFRPLHPYSKALMGAIVVAEKDMKSFTLSCIPGAPPNLKHRMDGCRFAPRCGYAVEACRTGEIDMKDAGGRQYRCILETAVLRERYANG